MSVATSLASLFGSTREAKVGTLLGGGLFLVGAFDRRADRGMVLKVAGAAVLVATLLREQRRTGTVGDALEGAAALPAGNAGVHPVEKALGVLGRAFGIEPEPGIDQVTERAADESAGPVLGQPRNALLVAGAWRQPLEGGTFNVATFSDTFQANAVVENQSDREVAGQVRVRITHEGLLQSGAQFTIFEGPSIRLAPGEMRELAMRLPTVRDADGRIGLALLFSGYNLASITAQRSLVFA
jgi:hypothetical protein